MKKLLLGFALAAIAVIGFASLAHSGMLPPELAALTPNLHMLGGHLDGWQLPGTYAMALAANASQAYEGGNRNDLPVKGSSKIYEGSCVGLVAATGLARALSAGDRFAGFAEQHADNSAGNDSDINVRLIDKSKIVLSVAGAVITDVGQPVYASDDGTFVFSPVGNSYVGNVKRFISAGVVLVEYDAQNGRDPYGNHTARVTISVDTTIDATYCGKLLWVDTDAKTITLPAVAAGIFGAKIVNGGAFGTVLVTIAPNASDSILGPDITAADNKALLNTKATAKRGDYVTLDSGDADGYLVTEIVGTWARAA